MNHKKDLDYIPQLPLSVKTLVFVNNYLPHINRETFVNVSSKEKNVTENHVKLIDIFTITYSFIVTYKIQFTYK
jgi:hypothetical protein